MTAPRFVVPGQVYLITRRCSERRFFLKPDPLTNQVFVYCLAEAARRFQLRVIAWLAMSNHYHAVVEDPHGVLPEFLCHFHKLTARCLNAHWGRRENLWAAEEASAVRLVELADVLEKVVYTLANPVQADLVDRTVDWPGASSYPLLGGRATCLKRPVTFFRRNGKMPARIELATVCPSGWPGGAPGWAEAVRQGVAAREGAARLRRSSKGVGVVGRKALRGRRPWRRPITQEAKRELRPHVACANRTKRTEELASLSRFRRAYAKARALFAAGKEVVFPRGTYMLVRSFAVPCSTVPA